MTHDYSVSPFKKVTRDAGQFMAEAPSAFLASLKSQAESVKQKITPNHVT